MEFNYAAVYSLIVDGEKVERLHLSTLAYMTTLVLVMLHDIY